MLDLQKGNIWKRISAFLCDIILLFVVITGIASLTAWVVDIDSHFDEYTAVREEYAHMYNIDLEADTSGYTEEELKEYNAKCDAADAAFAEDERALRSWSMLITLIPVIVTVSVFLGYLIMEFIIPLWLKEGRTLGKKNFGLCVMRVDGVRVSNVQMFVRTVLGKFTVGTMIPLTFLALIILNVASVVAPVGIIAIFGVQVIMMISTKNHDTIPDKMAGTVVVDNASQMIFESEEELVAYKKRLAAERAERSPY